MKASKVIISIILLVINCQIVYCQETYYISFLGFDKTIFFSKDAKANGYYNSLADNVIYEVQSGNKISRQLLDSNFIVQKKYIAETKNLSLTPVKKKSIFFKEFSTNSGNYETYISKKYIEVIKLNFEKGIDEKVMDLPLKKYYDDEEALSILPYNNNLLLLTYTSQHKKILCYELFFCDLKINYREFSLPKMPLTEKEIADRGEYLAVNYSRKFESPLYVSPLKNPDHYQVHTETQLFYDNEKLFFLFSMPYKAGYHLLELNIKTNEVSFSNYIVNKYKGGISGSNTEMLPVATLCDSLLIVQNSDYSNLEYHFFNFFTKSFLQKYSAKADSSFYNIVHSKLKQAGTNKDRNKEISFNNIKKFLKEKNQGLLFLKGYKQSNDSLIVIFGSYLEAGEDNPSSRAYNTLGFLSSVFSIPVIQWLPTVYSDRHNFLFASSAFDANTLTPLKNVQLNTPIDRFVSDKKMDDLEWPSSFLFEMKSKIYMGIFNKKENAYKVYVY